MERVKQYCMDNPLGTSPEDYETITKPMMSN
jgi:hypothetical protein